MDLNDFLKLLASQYIVKPDDHALSVGDWDYSYIGTSVPRFVPSMRITVGDIRRWSEQ